MAYSTIRRVLPLPQTAPQFAMPANRTAPARPMGGMSSSSSAQDGGQQRGVGSSPLGDVLSYGSKANQVRNLLAGKPMSGIATSSTSSGYGAVAPAGGDLGKMGSNGKLLQTINSPNAEPGMIGGSPPSTGMPEIAGSQGRFMGGSVSPYNEMPIPGPGQVTMSELPAPSGMGMNAGSAIGGAEGGMMGPEIGMLGQSGGMMGPEIGMAGAGGGGMVGPEIGMAGAEMFGPSMAEFGGMGGLGIGGAEAGGAGLAATEGVGAGGAAAGGAMAGGGAAAAGGETAAGGIAAASASSAPAWGPAAWIPLVVAAAAMADDATGGHVIAAPMQTLNDPVGSMTDPEWYKNFLGFNSFFGDGGLFG